MNLRHYLFLMSLATACCWLSLGIILVTLDPFASSAAGFAFFYASVFLSLLGATSLTTFFFLHVWRASPMPFQRVKITFITGFCIASVSVGLIYLQGIDVLVRWNTAIFFLMLVFLFFFVLSVKKRKNLPSIPDSQQ